MLPKYNRKIENYNMTKLKKEEVVANITESLLLKVWKCKPVS